MSSRKTKKVLVHAISKSLGPRQIFVPQAKITNPSELSGVLKKPGSESEVSYSDIVAVVAKTASDLKALGLKPGQRNGVNIVVDTRPFM